MAVRQMLVAGRYRLLEPVGVGGMGRVWLARDEELDRDIAIKELVPPDWMSGAEQDRLRQRTLREARSAARLSHPHVVRVYDIVHADDLSWIVMEYIRSRSLHEVLQEEGPYDPAGAARIGLAVLDGLDAAHQAGVLHRDVKPHNVLIGVDDRVVLTDFGLATFVGDGGITTPGLIVGSPQYVSPERARDGASTVESDLWSFGATLYAAVEGRSPYARETAMATLGALATEPPDPPVRAGPLAPVLAGLLRNDPAARLTAAEVARLLQTIISVDHRGKPLVPVQRGARRLVPDEPLELRELRGPAEDAAPGYGAGPPVAGGDPERADDQPANPVPVAASGGVPSPPANSGSGAPSGSVVAVRSAGAVGRARLRPLLTLPSAEALHLVPGRVTPEPAGSKPASSDLGSAEPAPSEPRRPEQAGSEQAGSEQAGSEQAGSEQAGSEQAGSEQARSQPVRFQPAPFEPVAPRPAEDADATSAHGPRFPGEADFDEMAGFAAMGMAGGFDDAADYAALDSWAEDQPESRFDFIEAEAFFTDGLDEPTGRPPAGAARATGAAWIPGSASPGDSEPLRVRPKRPPSEPAGPKRRHKPAFLRSRTGGRAWHGPARMPMPFIPGGTRSRFAVVCTLLLVMLGTGVLAGYLAQHRGPALRVVMPPVHSVLPVHPSKSPAVVPATPRRSALATSTVASSRATTPRVPATMVAGAAGFSPVVCDTPASAGLPVAPKKGAARGVNGGNLQAGWSYFSDGSGFHLAVPDGWSYERIGGTYCFRDPRSTRVLSLDVSRDPRADPLKACRAADRRLRLQGGLSGYLPIKVEAVPLVHKAADWEHRYRGALGALRHATTRWFVANGKAYALGWATPEDDWTDEHSNLQMVRATFYSTVSSADAARRG